MDILAKLNSGEFHAAARKRRPDCVDAKGNIHRSPERAAYVDWLLRMETIHGEDRREWPATVKAELERRHVPL